MNRLDKDYLIKLLESRREITEKGCWEYTRTRTQPYGYGQISIYRKRYPVHRLAAFLYKEFDLGSELEITHSCDNPPCFNPEHLHPMTHFWNIQDSVKKGRRRGGHNGGRKLGMRFR